MLEKCLEAGDRFSLERVRLQEKKEISEYTVVCIYNNGRCIPRVLIGLEGLAVIKI